MSTNVLFLVATPLHLYSTLEMIITGRFPKGADVLVTCHKIDHQVDVIERAQIEGLVGKVYHCEMFADERQNAKMALGFLFGGQRFEKGSALPGLIAGEYGEVIVFTPNALSAYIRLLAPEAQFRMGEDGVGTYTGDIFNRQFYFDKYIKGYSPRGKIEHILKLAKLRRGSILDLRFESVLVHQPDMVIGKLPAPVEGIFLPRCDVDSLVSLYGEDEGTGFDERILVLGQGDAFFDGGDTVETSTLANLGVGYSYRRHPSGSKTPSEARIDETKSWEIRCLRDIDENKILISHSSTAVLMPKMLTGCEPIIILTYRLYSGMDNGQRDRLDIFFDKFRLNYMKDRFFIPNTKEELLSILRANL